jgi:hypothetical protein
VLSKSPNGRILTWHTLQPGESAALKRDANRPVVVLAGLK